MATAIMITALLVMALTLGVLLVTTSDPFSILFIFNFIHTSYKLICKEIERENDTLTLKSILFLQVKYSKTRQ